MEYEIVSDGSCDLPPELCREKNIRVVPFYVAFGNEPYEKEIEEMPIRTFYEKMVTDPATFPKSSMPSVQDYMDAFLPIVERGHAVLCICITTKFSGSYQSAMSAREMVLESVPDAQIAVMDSSLDTALQGMFVLEAVHLRDAGVPFERAVVELEAIRGTGRIFFTIGSLDYLKHGGRIGKLAGLAGSVLGIRPIITLKEGEIFPSGITRSRARSIERVCDLLWQHIRAVGAIPNEYRICVGYGYDMEEAKTFRTRVVEFLQEKGYAINGAEVASYQIGATIGVHTGPHPLGVGILRRAYVG